MKATYPILSTILVLHGGSRLGESTSLVAFLVETTKNQQLDWA